jgi:hypothetical protein
MPVSAQHAKPSAARPEPARTVNPRPFRPRPVLLGVLLLAFFAWLGWLLYLYFTTVRG